MKIFVLLVCHTNDKFGILCTHVHTHWHTLHIRVVCWFSVFFLFFFSKLVLVFVWYSELFLLNIIINVLIHKRYLCILVFYMFLNQKKKYKKKPVGRKWIGCFFFSFQYTLLSTTFSLSFIFFHFVFTETQYFYECERVLFVSENELEFFSHGWCWEERINE